MICYILIHGSGCKRKREDEVWHQTCKGWYESRELSLEVALSDSYTGRQMCEFKNLPNLCMRAMKQDEVQRGKGKKRKGGRMGMRGEKRKESRT